MTKQEKKIVQDMAESAVFAFVDSHEGGKSPNKIANGNSVMNLLRIDTLLKTGDKYMLKALKYAGDFDHIEVK